MISTAQFETECIAWINLGLALFSLPVIGLHIYGSVGMQNKHLDLKDTLMKFGIAATLWVSASILLKFAVYRRSYRLLKLWTVSQIVLVLALALYLIIHPPNSLIIVAGYTATFIYLLFSWWICEHFIQEINDLRLQSSPSPAKRDALPNSIDNNNNNNTSVLIDSTEFVNSIFQHAEDDESNQWSMQMKKVQRTSL